MKTVALLILSLVLSEAATACECGPLPPGGWFNQATAVFVGSPVSITNPTPIGLTLQVKMKVNETLKGKNGHTTTLLTPVHVAAWGFQFEVGKKYLIYATGSPEALQVNRCYGTKPLDSSALSEIAAIRRPVKPK